MSQNPQGDNSHPISEKQTNTDDIKLSTAIAVVTDPDFPLPVLDEHADTLRYVKSFVVLSVLLGTGVTGAWWLDTAMLQSARPEVSLPVIFVAVLGMLWFTGTIWIDWWELVLGYWWFCMPIGAAAGLVLVLNQEANTPLQEVQ